MRPILNLEINPEEFLEFYWLKEELLSFCKENKLISGGSKDVITKRIFKYLKTGEIVKQPNDIKVEKLSHNSILSLNSIIQTGYKNDERHRAFFKSEIGEHFKFNVSFMNWMKVNAGKTYSDSILEWNRIMDEKKKGNKTEISSQFQYNQYTRDFFIGNPNGKMVDAIKCWKHKKSLPGHNKYEVSDLIVLS